MKKAWLLLLVLAAGCGQEPEANQAQRHRAAHPPAAPAAPAKPVVSAEPESAGDRALREKGLTKKATIKEIANALQQD